MAWYDVLPIHTVTVGRTGVTLIGVGMPVFLRAMAGIGGGEDFCAACMSPRLSNDRARGMYAKARDRPRVSTSKF
jgi:hypothetical protein